MEHQHRGADTCSLTASQQLWEGNRMGIDTLTLRLAGILLTVLFIAAALSACGDEPGTWDEYTAWCSEASLQEPSGDEATYGEVSTFYAGVIERVRSTAPPAEAADWHNKYLALLEALKDLADAGPQDETLDPFAIFADSEIVSQFEEVGEALQAMPADARERLAAAGCLGGEDAGEVSGAATPTPAPPAPDSAGMTVAEYAQWCAALPDDIEPPTWGEFLEIVRPSLEEAEALIPPMALTGLHDAVLLFFRNSVVSASGFDADTPYDYTVLLVHGLVYVGQIDEMKGDWDDDVRAALVASGCIGPEIFGG